MWATEVGGTWSEKVDNRDHKKDGEKTRISVGFLERGFGFPRGKMWRRRVLAFFVIFLVLVENLIAEADTTAQGYCQRTPSDYEKMERFRKEFGMNTKLLDDMKDIEKLMVERRKMFEDLASSSRTAEKIKERINHKI